MGSELNSAMGSRSVMSSELNELNELNLMNLGAQVPTQSDELVEFEK